MKLYIDVSVLTLATFVTGIQRVTREIAVRFIEKEADNILIESIMRGTPVIAADIPVSREVAGDYCVWFEQDNVEELCRVVKELHEDEEKYQKLKKHLQDFKATTWEECAEGMQLCSHKNS